MSEKTKFKNNLCIDKYCMMEKMKEKHGLELNKSNPKLNDTNVAYCVLK